MPGRASAEAEGTNNQILLMSGQMLAQKGNGKDIVESRLSTISRFINLNVQELLRLQYSRVYTLQPTAATDQTFLGSNFHLLFTCMYIKANAGIYRLTGHKITYCR